MAPIFNECDATLLAQFKVFLEHVIQLHPVVFQVLYPLVFATVVIDVGKAALAEL